MGSFAFGAALARTDGGPAFSARIFDDAAAAEAARHRGYDSAFEHLQAQHLVAMYTGGSCTGLGYPYHVTWYPTASADTPEVGGYVDSEQWLPRILIVRASGPQSAGVVSQP